MLAFIEGREEGWDRGECFTNRGVGSKQSTSCSRQIDGVYEFSAWFAVVQRLNVRGMFQQWFAVLRWFHGRSYACIVLSYLTIEPSFLPSTFCANW